MLRQKNQLVIRNKNLEYIVNSCPKSLKGYEENYLTSQKGFSDYATTMYNLMKFSKLKIN